MPIYQVAGSLGHWIWRRPVQHPIEHFCCRNPECSDCGVRGRGNLSFRGWSGTGKRIRMVYCHTGKARFSERKGTVLSHAKLREEKAVALLEHVRGGCGTRPTARLIGVDKNTVTRYIVLAGAHAESVHDELVAFSPSDS
jgi:transposase-like protein